MGREFYVYALMDPRKPGVYEYGEYKFDHEPFYIGKGSRHRVSQHVWKAKNTSINHPMLNKVRAILAAGMRPLSAKIKSGLTEEDAFSGEGDAIRAIGRKDTSQGPLANLSDGGEGDAGWISNRRGRTYEDIFGEERAAQVRERIGAAICGREVSEETRRKLSAVNQGKVIGEETKRRISLANTGRICEWKDKISAGLRGRSLSEDQCRRMSEARKGKPLAPGVGAKMSAARTGKPFTPERKANISLAKLGMRHSLKTKALLSEQRKGKTYEEFYGAESARRMKENRSIASRKCYAVTDPGGIEHEVVGLVEFCETHGLSVTSMYRVAYGGRKSHKGWKCRRVEP